MALLAVQMSLLAAPPAEALAARQQHPKVWVPPHTALPSTKSVGGKNAPKPGGHGPSGPVPKNWQPSGPVAKPTGSATVPLPKTGVQAGKLPIWLADAGDSKVGKGAKGAAVMDGAADAPSVRVGVLDESKSKAVGVPGPVVTLENAGAAAGKPVQVTLDVKALTGAAGWSDRARLVELPACALTTPDKPECKKQTPVESTLDAKTGKLTAKVAMPTSGSTASASGVAPHAAAATTSSAMVLAATSSSGGGTGTYAASAIAPSAAWSAGSNAGNFTYGYTLNLPANIGGAAPSMSLGYDSSAVDGKTASTNSQSSWIGDGWDYEPGAISRSYKSCISDGISNSGDECWGGQALSLNLAGHSGQIVKDDSTGALHLQGEDGTLIEPLTGLNNGAWNGEGFRVTTTDGTVYYFGANHLPGGDGTDAASNSAFTVPVYSPNSGDPCYSSSTGQASWCQMGFQWNLDYVVDPHGNLITYQYAQETNYYSRGGGQNNLNGTLTQYTRGGYPTQVAYGQRLSDQIAAKGAANAAVKVQFSVSERCLPSGSITCDPSQRTTANQSYWPDSPLDQACASSGSCSNYGPTFWSTKRLTGITTQVLVGSSYTTVDTYAFTQSFPDPGDGTKPSLWLSSIQRTGSNGQTSTSVPPVSFTALEIANRVDGLVPAAPQFNRPRIQQITTETGGMINVSYRNVECSRVNNTMPASADSNTMACMPVNWYPPGSNSPVNDWFQKILVSEVTEQDGVAGSVAKVTDYTYGGGAAWHRNDSEFADNNTRTWDQFRGYQTVTTTTGAGGDTKTQAVVTYLRGMDGDATAAGGTKSVSVSDTWGGSITDSAQYAGFVRESQTFDVAGGKVLAGELSTPWVGPVTATHTQAGSLPKITAQAVNTAQVKDRALLSDGVTWRTTERDATYDGSRGGRVLTTDVKGDLTHPEQEVCTSTSYASGSNAQFQEFPSRVLTLSGACGQTPTASNIVSDTLTYYDSQSLGVIGSLGEQTSTQVLVSYDGSGNPVYRTTAQSSYDVYGRQVSSTDPNRTDAGHLNGATTNTAYTPATGALPTSVSVTNPLGWTSTTTMDPGRAVPTHMVDENNHVIDETYDGLGRLTAVWTGGRSKATQSANRTFSYALNGTSAPSTVTSHSLRDDNTYSTSIQIYDGLGRMRQSQSIPVYGTLGRIITDAAFDTHGWQIKSSPGYYNADSGPTGTIFLPQDSQVPAQAWNVYDGLGRVTASKFMSYAQEQWRTTISYPGADEVDVTPPAGGFATASISDATGALVATRQYQSNTPTGAYDQTTYGHDVTGRPVWRKDSSGNTWSYTYDLLGEQTSSTDPDTGALYSVYDNAGHLVTSTDARGKSTSFSYDLLGRKTGEFDGTSNTDTTKQIAAWSYDTLVKGKPASSTRYVNGAAYTKAVTGYDAAYRPTGASVTIPSSENGLQGTYTSANHYTANVGLLKSTDLPAVGGVAAERVSNSYDVDGNFLGSSGANYYVTAVQYDAFGHPTRTTVGPSGNQVVSTQVYDAATGHVTQSTIDKQTAATASVDATTYTYNPAGNMTSVRDVQDGSAVDQQCFTYDYLGRLTAAWTDTGNVTTQPAPSVPAIGGCTNSTEPTAATASSRIGGPSPYWQSYSYDKTGNRTGLIQHDPTGNTANDVNISQTFATGPNTPTTAQNTGGGTGGPHALLTSTKTVGGASTQSTYQYDAAGNTTAITNTAGTKNLTWDGQGKTSSVVSTGNPPGTSYIYDADGSQLIRKDPGKTTLNLGADEVTLDTTVPNGPLTDTRYYPAPGGLTITRTTAIGGGTLVYQAADPHGTNGVQIGTDANQTEARRPTDPFGNARGTQPAANTWAGDKGFVGGTLDPATGLTNLGAREYDPTTGRFLAPDPLLVPGDPQQWNGYAYADNNPVDHSDPGGTCIPDDNGRCMSAAAWEHFYATHNDDGSPKTGNGGGGGGGGGNDGGGGGGNDGGGGGGGDGAKHTSGTSAVDAAAAAALQQKQAADAALAKAKQERQEVFNKIIDAVGDLIGFNDARDCFTKGDVMGCIQTALNFVPWGKVFKAVKVGIKAFKLWKEADKAYNVIHDAEKVAVDAEKAYTEARTTAKEAEEAEAAAAKASEGPSPEAKTDTPSSEPTHSDAPAAEPEPSHVESSEAPACPIRKNSFPAGTQVELSNGTTKSIDKLQLGDEVLATDPQTGVTKPEPVVDTIIGRDDVDFTELTVAGSDHPNPQKIISTAHHPYWDVTTARWTDATSLRTGDQLRVSDGTAATVIGARSYHTVAQTAFNLTVATLHTYFVLAGSTPLLVHNCGPEAGNGGSVEHLSASEQRRIQNAADRIGRPISVVGSRARGAAGPESDWDYVIEGINSRTKHSVKSSLPQGPVELGVGRRYDIFTWGLAEGAPYITFFPRGACGCG